MGIGPLKILLILLALILVFGAKRIPQVAKGIGVGIRNFKGSLKAGTEGDSGQGEEPRS
ncbi:MAG: twin-arginine translocase TatA/TatE family subunit [Gemmatimonadetes bacterium]|nr:twin-arginine translocase TatA/TatE family subunit [Gemmatimonadota bacterium]